MINSNPPDLGKIRKNPHGIPTNVGFEVLSVNFTAAGGSLELQEGGGREMRLLNTVDTCGALLYSRNFLLYCSAHESTSNVNTVLIQHSLLPTVTLICWHNPSIARTVQ